MKNNISMKDFYEKYTDNNSEKLPILDVRENHEYAAGQILCNMSSRWTFS